MRITTRSIRQSSAQQEYATLYKANKAPDCSVSCPGAFHLPKIEVVRSLFIRRRVHRYSSFVARTFKVRKALSDPTSEIGPQLICGEADTKNDSIIITIIRALKLKPVLLLSILCSIMVSQNGVSTSKTTCPNPIPPAPLRVGTALSSNPPTLFTSLTIRSLTFQNRIWTAPMCMYAAENGHLTDFHLVHLGAFALRGASLIFTEATAVRAEGRITPQCAGLWEDQQIPSFRRVADFVHSQGQKLCVQLAHAGRKASTIAPWLVPVRGATITATKENWGWGDEIKGPSAIKWGEGYSEPSEMTIDDIKYAINGFRDSARRAVEAGIDAIEIHAAHGYLICSFMSPISNHRTDNYGGSFENRIRLLLDVVQGIRELIPSEMPLFVRISSTEWMDGRPGGSWQVEDSIRLAKLLPGYGVDVLDLSSGGNHPDQKIAMHSDFQVGIAAQVRSALHKEGLKDLLIAAVGMITDATVAGAIVNDKQDDEGAIRIRDEQGNLAKADVVLIARQFLREAEFVLNAAHTLGVEVQWPDRYQKGKARTVRKSPL